MPPGKWPDVEAPPCVLFSAGRALRHRALVTYHARDPSIQLLRLFWPRAQAWQERGWRFAVTSGGAGGSHFKSKFQRVSFQARLTSSADVAERMGRLRNWAFHSSTRLHACAGARHVSWFAGSRCAPAYSGAGHRAGAADLGISTTRRRRCPISLARKPRGWSRIAGKSIQKWRQDGLLIRFALSVETIARVPSPRRYSKTALALKNRSTSRFACRRRSTAAIRHEARQKPQKQACRPAQDDVHDAGPPTAESAGR